jgi:hypothetical protein
MFWAGLLLGLAIGFGAGVWAVHGLIQEERRKALEMATALVNAGGNQLQVVHPPSASVGGNQQFNFEVICGGGHGAEDEVSGM